MRAVGMVLLAVGASGCLALQSEVGPKETLSGPLGLTCLPGLAPDACNVLLSGPGVNEFWAAANPKDPLNAVIAGNDYGAPERRSLVEGVAHGLWGVYWVTKDGGKTWTNHTVGGMLTDHQSPLWGYSFVGDMVTAFGPDATCYVGGIAYQSLVGASRNAVFLMISKDGCSTFGTPILIDSYRTEAAFHDKPAIAIDADQRIYMVWNFRQGLPPRPDQPSGQMRLGISQDGGRTWTYKPLVQGDSGISASIAIGPDGSVNIAWRAYNPLAIRFARSDDHGATFTRPVIVRDVGTASLTVPRASYRAFILPTITALPDGRLLVIADNRKEGTDGDIHLSTSADAGRTWSTRRLNQDRGEAWQFLPTIASDKDGRVVAAWLDRRDDDSDTAYRLYTAFSDDGERFHERPVSSEPSGGRSSFIGDYIGLAISGDHVYAAWPDLRVDGSARLFAAHLVLSNNTLKA